MATSKDKFVILSSSGTIVHDQVLVKQPTIEDLENHFDMSSDVWTVYRLVPVKKYKHAVVEVK